jgi:hypothetical protein
MKEKIAEKTKLHIEYRTSTGELVPGASTIAGMDKNTNILMAWAVKLTKQGLDYRKYTDEKAEIGTCVHEMILNHLKKTTQNKDKYSKEIVDKAENSFISYLSWEKQHKIELISAEEAYTSDIYRFGGTWDMFAFVDSIPTLVDFKSGSGIYDSHWYQVSGYSQLLIEKYQPLGKPIPMQITILNIPRTETEAFKTETRSDLTIEWEIFKSYLIIYHKKNELKRKLKGE